MASRTGNKASEFAGRPGLIQASADGHVEMTPGEEAMVMRRQGMSDRLGLTEAEQIAKNAQTPDRGQPAMPVVPATAGKADSGWWGK